MHTHHQLTGKELLIGTLKHQKMPAVAWVPFAGIHAGKLKNYTALEILTDGSKLLESLLAVNQVYDPDGQPVLFDLQVEAEILGCDLAWAQDAPPSVASHPLADNFVIPTRLPEKTDGRLPMILKVMQEMKKKVGDHTALYGLVTGPFTLASHLRGTELFMDMVDNEEYVRALLDYCKKVCIRMAEMYVEAGMDVIAVVDPVISQISPRHFKRFMSVPFSEVFAAIRAMGVLSSFFVCGDATKNIEVMCQTNPDSISIDENIDMVKAKEITDRYNICIGGNIPLTTRMLLGTQQDNMKYVVDLLDQLDTHNLVISPGCDMPYAVPIENTVGVLQAVREPEATRQLLANYHAIESNLDITLPDYVHLPRPLVEVFTIDSATCAACGYMKRIAERACSELNGKIDMVEYKITQPENIARIKKMGISHLPALAVNGEIKFLSVIPSIRELLEEIRKVM
ncbi:MAG TPA: uroporphyrinogen decarboxylase family protein [Anaerolineaceae bacterium]